MSSFVEFCKSQSGCKACKYDGYLNCKSRYERDRMRLKTIEEVYNHYLNDTAEEFINWIYKERGL